MAITSLARRQIEHANTIAMQRSPTNASRQDVLNSIQASAADYFQKNFSNRAQYQVGVQAPGAFIGSELLTKAIHTAEIAEPLISGIVNSTLLTISGAFTEFATRQCAHQTLSAGIDEATKQANSQIERRIEQSRSQIEGEIERVIEFEASEQGIDLSPAEYAKMRQAILSIPNIKQLIAKILTESATFAALNYAGKFMALSADASLSGANAASFAATAAVRFLGGIFLAQFYKGCGITGPSATVLGGALPLSFGTADIINAALTDTPHEIKTLISGAALGIAFPLMIKGEKFINQALTSTAQWLRGKNSPLPESRAISNPPVTLPAAALPSTSRAIPLPQPPSFPSMDLVRIRHPAGTTPSTIPKTSSNIFSIFSLKEANIPTSFQSTRQSGRSTISQTQLSSRPAKMRALPENSPPLSTISEKTEPSSSQASPHSEGADTSSTPTPPTPEKISYPHRLQITISQPPLYPTGTTILKIPDAASSSPLPSPPLARKTGFSTRETTHF